MLDSYNAVIDQALTLLQGISETDYQKVLQPHFSGSVGAHIRHIVDHFLALKNGATTGHIDYNIRHRHNQVEQFPELAIEVLNDIKVWILSLDSSIFRKVVSVTTEIDIQHTKSATCESTVERELVFVSSHAIHHYALIRIMFSMQNKALPDDFGYAPASITYINQSA
jgi:hypothetical protein